MGRKPRIAQARRKRSAALENVHEVEAIRCIRLQKGKLQYLIKWKGWSESCNTWEPHENLVNCNAVIKEFERRQNLQGYLETSSQALVPYDKENQENFKDSGSKGVKKRRLGFKRAVRMALAARQQLEATGTDGKESSFVSRSDEEAQTEATQPPTVVRVIKAVKYTTTIVDGKRDLTVLFKVLRSDGTKMVVDNKYLRATCPYLLLDFYEDRVKHA